MYMEGLERESEKCLAEEKWIREDYLAERLKAVFELIRANLGLLVPP